MKIIASRVHSGKQLMQGLVARRRKEIALFTHGKYC
jgi:GH24 family phage-related lysozyme (muramidase)